MSYSLFRQWLTVASGGTTSLSATRLSFVLLMVCCFLLLFIRFDWSQEKGTCRDLEHRVFLSSHTTNSTWNVTVRALSPNTPYTNHLTFSYHDNPKFVGLNNVVCPLRLYGVTKMTRIQRQNLKPRIIRGVILATRSRHVAFVDYDANFIHWPPRPPSSLITQSTPFGNGVNTGGLIFYNARSHLPLLNRWISHESDKRHDQSSWHLMEQKSPVPRLTLGDGSFVEHYNWQKVNRLATIRRCRSLIAGTSLFYHFTTALIIVALIVKLFDTSKWHVGVYLPRRAVVNAAVLISIALCVLFTGDVYRQVGAAAPQISERVCSVPELALLPDGRLVTRRGTVGDANVFVAGLVRILGMRTASTLLSIWFLFLQQTRQFARVFVVVETAIAISMLAIGTRAQSERLPWGIHAMLSSSGYSALYENGKEYFSLQGKGSYS